MQTNRLQHFLVRLAELRQHLLPAAFDDTGLYQNEDQVATVALAYRVMAHAEIESYFEDRVLEAASAARLAWLQRGDVSRIAVCMLAFSGKAMQLPPDSLEAPNDNKRKIWPSLIDVGLRLEEAFATFNQYVRQQNHGIRESNLMALLLPIGIDHSKLDPVFLTEIDSFGSLRGAAAHSSSSRIVRQQVDPLQELRRVESLLPGIQVIDTHISQLIAYVAFTNQSATATQVAITVQSAPPVPSTPAAEDAPTAPRAANSDIAPL